MADCTIIIGENKDDVGVYPTEIGKIEAIFRAVDKSETNPLQHILIKNVRVD
jgi:hypothetical protein